MAKRWPANRPLRRRAHAHARDAPRAISPHEPAPDTDSCSDDYVGLDAELVLDGSPCSSAVPSGATSPAPTVVLQLSPVRSVSLPSSPASPVLSPTAAAVEDATLVSVAAPDAMHAQKTPVESLQVLVADGEDVVPTPLEEVVEKRDRRAKRMISLVSPLLHALRESSTTVAAASEPERKRPLEANTEHNVEILHAPVDAEPDAAVVASTASRSKTAGAAGATQGAKHGHTDTAEVLIPLSVLEPFQDNTAERSLPQSEHTTEEEAETQVEETSKPPVKVEEVQEPKEEVTTGPTQGTKAKTTTASARTGPSATHTSSGSSSSSNGETRALFLKAATLHAHQLRSQKAQRPDERSSESLAEDSATDASATSVRRSSRKRRAVDLLRPSDGTPTSTRKRRAGAVAAKTNSIKKALSARPAATAVAAARAAAAAKEKGMKMAASPATKEGRRGRKKSPGVPRPKAAAAKGKSPCGLLSPMQDEQKKTPRKSTLPKKSRRSLEATFGHETTDFEARMVKDLIAELYEEQEQDDRSMYNITTETVRAETSACTRSQEVEELSLEEFRRLMTYGEVSVESVSSTILPFLRLEKDDVFFDLGCGTGKILVQAALQTPCRAAVGLELMQNRVTEGHKALARLEARSLEVLRGKRLEVLQGDICAPPDEARLMDATVVFINNVMFGPTLMLKVLELLQGMPRLKRVVTLRKICERHGQAKCMRAKNFCVQYVHPPQEAEIHVSWASKTSVYLYESVDFSVSMYTQLLGKASASTPAPPRPTPIDHPRQLRRKHHAPANLAARMDLAAHD